MFMARVIGSQGALVNEKGDHPFKMICAIFTGSDTIGKIDIWYLIFNYLDKYCNLFVSSRLLPRYSSLETTNIQEIYVVLYT